MRIIAGKFKNKLVNTLDTKELRPTLSKIRESIFDVLQQKTESSVWLDLFAGSGLVGIEAASRNAKEVIFIEKNPRHYKLLKQNLSSFDFDYKVYLNDATRALKYFTPEQFDVIFLDPPYKMGLVEKVLPVISQKNLLKKDGLLIIECELSESFDKIIEKTNLSLLKSKEYGSTKLLYFYLTI